MSDLKSLSDLKSDPRNPRTITEEAASGLGSSLKEFGDLSGIVFNLRTGQLVAGHQRLGRIKEMYGDVPIRDGHLVLPTGDKFRIRYVDWPEEKQKAANLAANNPRIMGQFTSEAITLLDEVKIQSTESFNALLLGDLRKDVRRLIRKSSDSSKMWRSKLEEKTEHLAWVVVGIPRDKYTDIIELVEDIAAVDTVVFCEVSSEAYSEKT